VNKPDCADVSKEPVASVFKATRLRKDLAQIHVLGHRTSFFLGGGGNFANHWDKKVPLPDMDFYVQFDMYTNKKCVYSLA
jgi:hypothetical protein